MLASRSRGSNNRHARSATTSIPSSSSKKQHKRAWSGVTRRNTVLGLDNGIGSGRATLSKLNSLTMSSKTRTEADRHQNSRPRHPHPDLVAIDERRNILSMAKNIPLQPPAPPPSPPTQQTTSVQRRDYSAQGGLDLSQFEYHAHRHPQDLQEPPAFEDPHHQQQPLHVPPQPAPQPAPAPTQSPPQDTYFPTTATHITLHSPSSLSLSPALHKPPPPPGPPPASAKRKTTKPSTASSPSFPASSVRTNQQPNPTSVHEEMAAMQQRIAALTATFKQKDEAQTVAIAALTKQNKQLERANTHLRRERDRILAQQRQRQEPWPNPKNKARTSTKNPIQKGLEIQLQQVRSQLSKEKAGRKEEVAVLHQHQEQLMVHIDALEKDAATTINLAHASDTAIASLTNDLQEARAQLRASAAASLQQFNQASNTTSPTTALLEPEPGLVRMDLVAGHSNEEVRGGSHSVVEVKTPHPKRKPPPRPL